MKQIHIRLLVIFGVISVSFAAILVKLSDATPLHNAFYRMLFSTLLMVPIFVRHSSELQKISRKNYTWMAASGIALGLHFYTWFISLNHTSIANSMVLICMSPIFTVSGGALLFGTKFKWQEILMTFTAILGGIIMALHSGHLAVGETYGNAMALLGSFLIAVYLLIGRYIRREVHVNIYTFFVYGFASIILLILTLFSQEPLLQQTPRSWMIFLLLAIFPTLLGHSLFSYALKYVKAAFISTSILFEPVLTILLASIIFAEYPDALQLLGGGVILISLGVYTVTGTQQQAEIIQKEG